ncbi:MAG: SprT-like domain-containing protein [Nannocystaceae bacterium]
MGSSDGISDQLAPYLRLDPGDQDRARAELEHRIDVYLRRHRSNVRFTDNVRTMLSVKCAGDEVIFRLHHLFVDAPAWVVRAMATYAESHDRDASELLYRYVEQQEHRIRERSSAGKIKLSTAGLHHNLQEIYDELNLRYFGGKVDARVTWGARRKRARPRASIKLGSYTVEERLIRLHPVLDAEDVPRYFVAWIVFHEMLHQVHEMPIVDGRRVYHTRQFRRAEQSFDRYADAVLWERTNLRRLLG